MSGLDLCTVLKEHEPQPYVILASGFHENARLLEGMRGGADDFLRKPFTVEELEVRLAAATRLLHAVRMVAEMNIRLRAQTAAQA
jgi:DNA-binding response OmpR family regulator